MVGLRSPHLKQQASSSAMPNYLRPPTQEPTARRDRLETRIRDKQAAIFEQEGISPSKVCIGHSDDTPDVEYLTGLARRGYYIHRGPSADRSPTLSGAPSPPPQLVRATLEQARGVNQDLIDDGLVDRVMLGTEWPGNRGNLNLAGAGQFRPPTIQSASSTVPDLLAGFGAVELVVERMTYGLSVFRELRGSVIHRDLASL